MYYFASPRTLWFISLSVTVPALGSIFPLPGPDPVCLQIASKLSPASDVYYTGDPKYEKGISHWSFLSTQRSKCVVEPGREADLAEILKIVGRTRTPFAIKGGGHAVNPGFSSTSGVHISMARFSEVKYQHSSQTAEVGMGLIWDDVYAALEPYNRTVVGGRVSGVGVAGFSLGGGYSWKTNQHGLTVDTIEAFRLVQPDGKISTVTHASQPELFFGLKGTQNNYGIVTKITYKTFPQNAVWGGMLVFDGSNFGQVNAATVAFHANVRDPKASMIATYGAMLTNPFATVLVFYDGPTPPVGIYDAFMAIPALVSDVKTRSYLSLVQASPPIPLQNPRILFQGIPHVDITPQFLTATVNELISSAQTLTARNDTYISLAVEPFLPNILQHTNRPSAYPGTRARTYLPFNALVTWPDQASDAVYTQAIKGITSRIRAAAVSQGQVIPLDAPSYPNYALYDTPLEHIFGDNLPRLRKLKKKVDPQNVMALAGGFKL